MKATRGIRIGKHHCRGPLKDPRVTGERAIVERRPRKVDAGVGRYPLNHTRKMSERAVTRNGHSSPAVFPTQSLRRIKGRPAL